MTFAVMQRGEPMTKDEALKKMQAVKSYMTSGNPIWSVTEMGEAFDMAIKALNAQRWIPCSERLPEVGQDVLFSVQDLFVSEGCLRDDGDWSQFRWQAIQKKESVTAWMTLPEPYKKKR